MAKDFVIQERETLVIPLKSSAATATTNVSIPLGCYDIALMAISSTLSTNVAVKVEPYLGPNNTHLGKQYQIRALGTTTTSSVLTVAAGTGGTSGMLSLHKTRDQVCPFMPPHGLKVSVTPAAAPTGTYSFQLDLATVRNLS